MLLFPWPQEPWQLVVLVLLAGRAIGMLWAPSMALLSDGAEALGIAQGLAFALSNVGWSIGQTGGAAASARLADATSDAVPYLLLSALALGDLHRAGARPPRRRRRPGSSVAPLEPPRAARGGRPAPGWRAAGSSGCAIRSSR